MLPITDVELRDLHLRVLGGQVPRIAKEKDLAHDYASHEE